MHMVDLTFVSFIIAEVNLLKFILLKLFGNYIICFSNILWLWHTYSVGRFCLFNDFYIISI